MNQKKKKRSIQVCNKSNFIDFKSSSIKLLFNYLDNILPSAIPDGELSIAFLNEEMICQIHLDYLNDPTPTDVITFQGDSDFDIAGEICVSVDYAIESSKKRILPLNFEITLYLVHGWLHLAGYDDQSPNEQQKMRLMEKKLIDQIKISDKLPIFNIKK